MTVRLIAALAVMCPGIALAETYLCIPSAGAIVSEEKDGRFTSNTLQADSVIKWLLTQVDGKWVVKEFSSGNVWYDLCHNDSICEDAKHYGGFFMRDPTQSFTITWISFSNEKKSHLTAKGKCSKIEV